MIRIGTILIITDNITHQMLPIAIKFTLKTGIKLGSYFPFLWARYNNAKRIMIGTAIITPIEEYEWAI